MLLVSASLVLSTPVKAQNGLQPPVGESWNSVTVRFKPNKSWTFSLEEQLRIETNQKPIDQFFTELGIGYEPIDGFVLKSGFRYIGFNDNEGAIQQFRSYYRFHTDLAYKYKVNIYTVKLRWRYQRKNQLGKDVMDGDYIERGDRLKVSVYRNFKNWKLDPKFHWEIFYRSQIGSLNGFNKYRIGVQTDFKIYKERKLEIGYLFERGLNVWDAERSHILTLAMKFDLKRRKN